MWMGDIPGAISFSTHILTRRMTIILLCTYIAVEVFNSHPHKEDDELFDKICSCVNFSTHILTRRMTTGSVVLICISVFQLTSSQGG